MNLEDITFCTITREEAKPLILKKHYLHRMPPLSIAFGAYYKSSLIGVLTFGKPPSNSLCEGICGEAYSAKVFELNRLYTVDEAPKNLESKFIAHALRALKSKNLILVSYADDGMGHRGYIYQATNWLYTGVSSRRTDVYVGQGGHSRSYTEAQRLFVIRKVRSLKHRYVYFCGHKTFKKQALKALKYSVVEAYPKGDSAHYAEGEGLDATLYHKGTGETFKESDFLRAPWEYLSEAEYIYYLEHYILGG